jgi:hypothetical protein
MALRESTSVFGGHSVVSVINARFLKFRWVIGICVIRLAPIQGFPGRPVAAGRAPRRRRPASSPHVTSS